MHALAEFALGLGLFFVGMQMVGENLHQLSGPSFRTLIARFTASSWAGALLGTAAGAMMQSATGVTFILVNMVEGGLITTEAALPVITWTNVGLTLLAFVASLDIHPLIAWGLGISGVAASLVRQRAAKQVAGVLVGVGLLLYGLQSMGAAAGPLARADSLPDGLANMLSITPLAFLAGFALAATLQSNTGATLLVIALAAGGVFDLPQALMLIYGTNLGAIVLRLLLSLGMRGTALQLVRYEDLFCLLSAAIMVTLFYVERFTGLPLVMAGVTAISSDIAIQLALGFLLLNLLPALVMGPLAHRVLAWLVRLWPVEPEADAAQPKYLTPRALEDPATAVDLIPRELARLLTSLQSSVRAHREGRDSSPVEDRRAADYATLTRRIEDFAGQLALAPLERSVADRLNVAREITAVVGYLAEGYVELRRSHRELRHIAGTAPVREQVLAAVDALFGAAATAVDTRDPAAIFALREQSRTHSALVEKARESCVRGAGSEPGAEQSVSNRTAVLKLLRDFELITWIVHRLSKSLEQFNPVK